MRGELGEFRVEPVGAFSVTIEPGDLTRYKVFVCQTEWQRSVREVTVGCQKFKGGCSVELALIEVMSAWERIKVKQFDDQIDDWFIKSYAEELGQNPWTVRALVQTVGLLRERGEI